MVGNLAIHVGCWSAGNDSDFVKIRAIIAMFDGLASR
jgi:hypothetical protein